MRKYLPTIFVKLVFFPERSLKRLIISLLSPFRSPFDSISMSFDSFLQYLNRIERSSTSYAIAANHKKFFTYHLRLHTPETIFSCAQKTSANQHYEPILRSRFFHIHRHLANPKIEDLFHRLGSNSF